MVEKAAGGELTARAGALRIHSAYDPKRESRRFLAGRLNDFRRGATVVIVGAGLGYLDQELKLQRPDLTVLACHLLPELSRHIGESPGIPRWNPDQGDAGRFILSHVGELDLPGLRVLEWEPSVRAAPEAAAAVTSALAAVIRRHSGNISATAVFGRRWLRNTLRNYAEIEHLGEPQRQSGTTVIAAAGPSLEDALPTLARERAHFHLWALPSAAKSLAAAGIRPDLIFSTDPGFWARLHWRYFEERCMVAMPFCSAPPPVRPRGILLIREGALGESDLLRDNLWPAVHVPRAGSVAITAVEAWKRMADGPLVLAGLDFAWRDLASHARPHTFDGWLAGFDSRVKPALSTAWERASTAAPRRIGAYRSGSSLTTYRDWFQNTPMPRPVYRFNPRGCDDFAVELPSIGVIDEVQLRKLPVRSQWSCPVRPVNPAPQLRRVRIRDLIRSWTASVEGLRTLDEIQRSEIIYTIDPGGVLDLKRRGALSSDAELQDELQGLKHTVLEVLEDLERRYNV